MNKRTKHPTNRFERRLVNGNKKKGKPMERNASVSISKQNVMDALSPFLRATGYIHDNEEMVDISMVFTSDLMVPVVFKVKRLHSEEVNS